MHQTLLAILTFCLLSCRTSEVNKCVVPEKVQSYIDIHFKGSRIITVEDIMTDWKSFAPNSTICPAMIELDFTRNGAKDFVLMIRKSDGMPYLIAVNDFETSVISHQVIEGVADYGEHGIGSIIYPDEKQEGFYFHKPESSMARVYWKDGKYELNYVVD